MISVACCGKGSTKQSLVPIPSFPFTREMHCFAKQVVETNEELFVSRTGYEASSTSMVQIEHS